MISSSSLTRPLPSTRTYSSSSSLCLCPNDLAFADTYLYVINPNVGTITAYKQQPDGSLQPFPGAELGTSLAGLAAR